MPTFTGKAFANFYKNILGLDQSSNTGVSTSVVRVQDGEGKNTVLSLSDDQFVVKPVNTNETATMTVSQNDGTAVFKVDTANKLVYAGSGATKNVLTHFKEMGLYDFSPNTGYHYPLIANTMFVPDGATAFAADGDWGNGTDPADALDVSGLTAQENAIAVYWYLENNIALDSVRFMATADGSATLNFHIMAYDLDVSSNYGDLSNGTVCASGTVAATNATVKTDTMTLNTISIDAGKVVIGFIENATDTSDVSISVNLKYHIR